MSPEDLKVLAERADTIEGRQADRLHEVHQRIKAAQRQRRTAAGLVGAGLVSALVVGLAVLAGPKDRAQDPDPTTPTPSPSPASPTVRDLVWTDEYWPTYSFHLGATVVDIRDQVTEAYQQSPTRYSDGINMDVTDDGVVFAGPDGLLWFADGDSVEQIGDVGHDLRLWAPHEVATGNTGSLVTWVAYSEARRAEVVVFDTRAGREVARVPARGCVSDQDVELCHVDSVVGTDHVYWVIRGLTRADKLMRLVLSTGTSTEVTREDLEADLRIGERGLIVGDSPESGPEDGVATSGIDVSFLLDGRRLIAVREQGNDEGVSEDRAEDYVAAYDTRTGKPVELRVPDGYRGGPMFVSFEWLDDDRLALFGLGHGWGPPGEQDPGNGDILVCRISTGKCDLVVRRTTDYVIVPHLMPPG